MRTCKMLKVGIFCSYKQWGSRLWEVEVRSTQENLQPILRWNEIKRNLYGYSSAVKIHMILHDKENILLFDDPNAIHVVAGKPASVR